MQKLVIPIPGHIPGHQHMLLHFGCGNSTGHTPLLQAYNKLTQLESVVPRRSPTSVSRISCGLLQHRRLTTRKRRSEEDTALKPHLSVLLIFLYDENRIFMSISSKKKWLGF